MSVPYIRTGLNIFCGVCLVVGLAFIFSLWVASLAFAFLVLFVPRFILWLTTRRKPNTMPDESLDEIQAFANSITSLHDLPDVHVETTEERFGYLDIQFGKPHRICVPEETNPETLTLEAQAVVAHECAHLKYRDGFFYGLKRLSLVLGISVGFYAWLSADLLSGLVFGLVLLILSPAILYYFLHGAEFRADDFAIKNVSRDAVSQRLRRFSSSQKISHIEQVFPYIHPYPKQKKRTERLYDAVEINSLDS